MATLFPDFVETDINLINTFTFRLPATALGIDSDLLVEIVVEYGENPSNAKGLIANAWAREVGGVTSGFIAPIHLSTRKNEQPMEQAARIVSALNESKIFQEQLSKFVRMLIRHKQ